MRVDEVIGTRLIFTIYHRLSEVATYKTSRQTTPCTPRAYSPVASIQSSRGRHSASLNESQFTTVNPTAAPLPSHLLPAKSPNTTGYSHTPYTSGALRRPITPSPDKSRGLFTRRASVSPPTHAVVVLAGSALPCTCPLPPLK